MYIHVKKKDAHPSSSKRYWDEAHGVRLSMASAIPSYIKLGVLSANSSIPNPVDFQMPPEVRSCFTSSPPKRTPENSTIPQEVCGSQRCLTQGLCKQMGCLTNWCPTNPIVFSSCPFRKLHMAKERILHSPHRS